MVALRLLLARSGALRPIPVRRISAMLRALGRYGILGAATVIAAARDHDGVALNAISRSAGLITEPTSGVLHENPGPRDR